MINIPIYLFILLLTLSIPTLVLILAWFVMFIAFRIADSKEKKHRIKIEKEIKELYEKVRSERD